jgi:gamma-tubulin complex component 2
LFLSGLVLHALCAALRTLLKEYLILVAQLESQARGGAASSQGALTLQRLFFYCQPALHTLSRLHRLTSRIRTANVHGGALLNLIHGCLRTEG